jgi:predicted secreted protein
MTITAAIVLYAMIWFWVFLMVLPMRLKTQGEAGEVVRGTPSSAPMEPGIRRKLKLATLVGSLIWAVAAGIILSGAISLSDIDFFNRMAPVSPAPAGGGTGG